MPIALSIEGQGLAALNRKMKALDAKKLKRDLNKALREAAKPLLPKAQDAARSNLPKRGGLASTVGDASFKVSVTQRGVKIVAKGAAVQSSNKGRIRHPVFGRGRNARDARADVWVVQKVTGGWFDDTMQKHKPDVREAVMDVLTDFAQRVNQA